MATAGFFSRSPMECQNRESEKGFFFMVKKGKESIVAIINEDEIFAGIHKFKLFRKEGNLFVDVYESIIGNPAHKFVAVPNLIMQESDKKYFGFGDTKADAIRDCLRKVKDVPIETIVPSATSSDHDLASNTPPNPKQEDEPSSSFWKPHRIFSKRKKEI
jgi:hypothetical protein